MSGRFSFPTEVNETAARVVAAGVCTLVAGYLVTGSVLPLVLLVYGFWARVACGPRFSPLALLATRVVVPRMNGPHRTSPGAPKRFAQTIGATLSSVALVLHLAGAEMAGRWVITALFAAALIEASIGLCLGCAIFRVLVQRGLVPDDVCQECADWARGRGRAAGGDGRTLPG